MEAVLKNLGDTAGLLAVAARSGDVREWDKQTLSRAFEWARYCEHLFSRFHENPAIRRIMEKQLQLTNDRLRAAFPGHAGVSFSDLSRCQHLLLVGLLHNPWLPISIMKTLFDTTSPVITSRGQDRDVSGICTHMIRCRSACEILGPLTDPSAVGADAEVQGVMLMERLAALLSRGSEACRPQRFLDSVLRGCKGEAQHFCLVIAAALLTGKNSDALAAAVEFVLDWLREKRALLRRMCFALPVPVLKDLAKEHRKFRDAYCVVLRHWATDMVFSLDEGEWAQSSADPAVSFQKLTGHYLALFEACPALRKTVETELNALKIADGDFDVRGLSVWGDLLSEIHKCQS